MTNEKMNIQDIRLANLETLAKDYETDKAFCAAAGLTPSYLSQLRSTKATRKRLGEEKSRAIEQKLGLEEFQLDKAPINTKTPESLKKLNEALMSLPPNIFKNVSALIYSMASDAKKAAAHKTEGAVSAGASKPGPATLD